MNVGHLLMQDKAKDGKRGDSARDEMLGHSFSLPFAPAQNSKEPKNSN